MKNGSKKTEKDSVVSIECIGGYQLNMPDKFKTAAVCVCDNDSCTWVFKKGDVMCVKELEYD